MLLLKVRLSIYSGKSYHISCIVATSFQCIYMPWYVRLIFWMLKLHAIVLHFRNILYHYTWKGNRNCLVIRWKLLSVDTVPHVYILGYFTHHGSQQVSQVVSLIKSRAAISSCDVAISKCLASIQKGKTDAIPLHNGQKSTRTAMLLRNAIILTAPQLRGHYSNIQSLPSAKGKYQLMFTL